MPAEWDECLAVIYSLSDLRLERVDGVLCCGLKIMCVYKFCYFEFVLFCGYYYRSIPSIGSCNHGLIVSKFSFYALDCLCFPHPSKTVTPKPTQPRTYLQREKYNSKMYSTNERAARVDTT
jgi:hypothetical protein